MSYFSASLKVNAEGDVLISDETVTSLGIILRFLHPLFATFTCALVSIYEPPHRTERHHGFSTDQALDADFFWQEDVMAEEEAGRSHQPVQYEQEKDAQEPLLIALVPHSGYFVAVGLSEQLWTMSKTHKMIGRH